MIGGFLTQRASKAEKFPCHDVIMITSYHLVVGHLPEVGRGPWVCWTSWNGTQGRLLEVQGGLVDLEVQRDPRRWKGSSAWSYTVFIVITVPVDGLAPTGARTSAGTLMTKIGSHIHWNRNVVISIKFSLMAASEVFVMTTSDAASDDNFVKITTMPFCFSVCSEHGRAM